MRIPNILNQTAPSCLEWVLCEGIVYGETKNTINSLHLITTIQIATSSHSTGIHRSSPNNSFRICYSCSHFRLMCVHFLPALINELWTHYCPRGVLRRPDAGSVRLLCIALWVRIGSTLSGNHSRNPAWLRATEVITVQLNHGSC